MRNSISLNMFCANYITFPLKKEKHRVALGPKCKHNDMLKLSLIKVVQNPFQVIPHICIDTRNSLGNAIGKTKADNSNLYPSPP